MSTPLADFSFTGSGARRAEGSPHSNLSRRWAPTTRMGSSRVGSGGCYSLPDVGGGERVRGWRRAGALWIGEPPRCCTRVEIAVDPYAGGCLRIGASMTASRREPLEIAPARIGSAAAVLRRVDNDSVTA